jgi:predicted Fe-S protein YdhL (DUF1289 family)
MNVSSPCTQICKLDNRNICIGCYRTSSEIARWMQMTDKEKLLVVSVLAGRRLGSAKSCAQKWEVASNE